MKLFERASPEERDSPELRAYVLELTHKWSRALAALAFTLVPMFALLDYFVVPWDQLPLFLVFRFVPTAIAVVLFFVLSHTKPGPWSIAHGYLLTLSIGTAVSLMTTYLGGFNSSYYAGLNLVIIAISGLLPWGFRHAATNSLLVLALYAGCNVLFPSPEPVQFAHLLSNLYFLTGTAVIAVSINVVKQRFIEQEYLSRSNLKAARDALWGEMELAKQIQTSLLPKIQKLPGYRVAATMLPAAEVGGDYYDVLETAAGETWLAIGDVSGHGVESGLIMMMAQTSLFTTINQTPGYDPSRVLELVNSVVVQNISRLGTDRYMTLCAVRVGRDRITFAGKHQDILVYRHARRTVVQVPTTGTWLGIVPNLAGRLNDLTVPVDEGDVVLLFTDGVTEATDARRQMYGQDRLVESLARHGALEPEEIVHNVLRDLGTFAVDQDDDITLMVLKRLQTAPRAEG